MLTILLTKAKKTKKKREYTNKIKGLQPVKITTLC